MENNKHSVSYQYISRDTFGLVSENLTSSNHIDPISISKDYKARPITSNMKRFGLKSSNYFNKNLESYNIRYLPKRKIRNTFISPPSIESLKPVKSHEPLSMPIQLKVKEDFKYQTNVNETYNRCNDYLKVRTGYILKFASNADFFNKTMKYFDNLSDDKQGPAIDLYDNLKRIYDLNSRIYFDKITCNSILDYETWKGLLRNSYDYNTLMIKLIDLLFRDLKNDKDNILRLKKKNFEFENQMVSKTNEIALINDFIKKNDLNFKLNQKKQKNASPQELKQAFIQKENAYVLTIYRLEDEIKGLSSLLEENKIDATKLQSSKDKAENRKKAIDEMRVVYNKEINDLNLRNSIIKEEGETLKEQIEEMGNHKKTLLVDIDNLKNTLFEVNKKNQMFTRVIDQRLEIINMLHEESIMYRHLYDKKSKEHKIAVDKLAVYETNKEQFPKL